MPQVTLTRLLGLLIASRTYVDWWTVPLLTIHMLIYSTPWASTIEFVWRNVLCMRMEIWKMSNATMGLTINALIRLRSRRMEVLMVLLLEMISLGTDLIAFWAGSVCQSSKCWTTLFPPIRRLFQKNSKPLISTILFQILKMYLFFNHIELVLDFGRVCFHHCHRFSPHVPHEVDRRYSDLGQYFYYSLHFHSIWTYLPLPGRSHKEQLSG